MDQRVTLEHLSDDGSDSTTESCSSRLMAKALGDLKVGNFRYEQQRIQENASSREPRSFEVQEKESKDELLFMIARWVLQKLKNAFGIDSSSLRLNPMYSDLTIKCRGSVFPVHKIIVCSRSVFFSKACSGGFKVRYEISLIKASF